MNEFLDLLLPRWGTAINDRFTFVFVYGIIAAFLILAIYFWLRTFLQLHLINGLTKGVREYDRPAEPKIRHDLKEKFELDDGLAEAWQEFDDSLIEHENQNENRKVLYKTDEASLFFSQDRLLGQRLNLRYWNSVPALLVGLGILGTFIGLVWGLIPFSGITFEQTSEIQEAIKKLLSGVSTAFVTSVWGMLTSLLFNGLEKWRISRVSRAIANLQHALDRLFTLTTQEAISFRQEVELAQQTKALKSFSTDLANEIKIAMAEGRQQILTELHNAPVAFSDAMVEQLAPSLNNLNTAVKELRETKEESAADAIRQLVEEFQKSISGSITAQMESLANRISQVSEGLITLPDQMTHMIEGIQVQINQARGLLTSTSEEQAEQMKDMMDKMLNAFTRTIETQQSGLSETTNQSIQTLQRTIAELQQSLTSTASQTAEESQGMVTRMLEFIESAANQADEQLVRRIADMEEVSARSIQSLETTIAELRQSLTSTASQTAEESQGIVTRMLGFLESAANRADEQSARRIADIESVSAQSIQSLETTIAELRESLTSNLNVQQQTIQNITSQTEAASVASIDRIRQLVEQSVERLDMILQSGEKSVKTLLSQQSNQISAINNQIANTQNTLAKGRDMLEQMNSTAANVRQMIETTQTFSSRLMLGADRLENAGQQLTQASSAFNQENENYLASNRETIQQLQGTLVESRELLNDFARRFQTIDAGLHSIFAEIQRGLTEYTTTSRDSINEYLSAFSTQLTSAANALAGSIEALNDDIEELSDMIERFRRR